MRFKKKSKVEVQEHGEGLRAEQRRWASRLTSLQVRTIRSDAAPRPTQAASVRQKLQELSYIYMLYLDERCHRLPGAEPLICRSWVGGLQSFVAVKERAESLVRLKFQVAAQAAAGGDDTRELTMAREKEVLFRIMRSCDGIILGFHQMAAGLEGAPGAKELHAGLPLPDLWGALGLERSPEPISQQSFAARFSQRGGSESFDKERWQRHWRNNFTWNNEVLYGPADSAVWIPVELRPPEHRDRRNMPPLELDSSSKALLDLAFDLGVDEVAVQTTLTLSGDITNHISPHLSAEERVLLLEMHRLSVENGLSYWTSLIEAVTAFLGDLLGLIFQSKDK